MAKTHTDLSLGFIMLSLLAPNKCGSLARCPTDCVPCPPL